MDLNIHDSRQQNSFVRTNKDSRTELAMSDRSSEIGTEPNEPERDIFAIARVIAERGYRNRMLCRASSIV
jgi:hypothetical protein